MAAGGALFGLRALDQPSTRVTAVVALAAEAGEAGASALDASGYVVARRQATVSAKITGRVVEMFIEEGQTVEAGDVIAKLDDSNSLAILAQARAQFAQTQAEEAAADVALGNAEPTFRRHERQFELGIISAQQLDDAKSSFEAVEANGEVRRRALAVARANIALAERNRDDTVVRAPFRGIVTEKAAQNGEIVSPMSGGGGFTRTGLCTIVDMTSLEVEVDVSENFINRVRAGQPATIRLNAYPDWAIRGEVAAIVPTADRARATVKVRVGFDETDDRVLPEMGARVSFFGPNETLHTPHESAAVLVPSEAVANDAGDSVVYVLHGAMVERRRVELGARRGAQQIVVSGLSAGTSVALGDLSMLADGASVAVAD